MFKYKKGLFISLLIGLTLISSFVEAVVPDATGSYVGVTKLSSTSVRISTKDNSNNEDGFYASLYEYASSVLIQRKEISASNDSTVYADFTGLVCNKLYSANIFAFNEDGNSSVSDTRHFNIHTTFSTICPNNIDVPSAPGSYIGVTDINKSAVRVNFLDNSDNEDGFLLFDESGDINITIPANNTTAPSQTYVMLTGLTCNRTYTIKALAFNTNGNSEESDVEAFNIHSTFGIPCGNPMPDTTKPVITLLGDAQVTVMVGNIYVDAGAMATDNVDGNITANIQVIGLPIDTSSEGNYTVTYSVSDSTGNEANVTRIINVIPIAIVDKIPPIITLNGDANLTLTQGQAYNELGATALDDVDGNVTVSVSGSVDTNTVEVYTLTYTATDSASNSASKTRTVNVINKIVEVPLTLESNSTELNLGTSVLLTVKSGETQDISFDVEWIVIPSDSAEMSNNILTAKKEGNVTIEAKYQGKTSNKLLFDVHWVINGHILPLEPDEAENNATLGGVDSNNNGVRDDVERKIREKYSKPLHSALLMYKAKFYQRTLVEPISNAIEIQKDSTKTIDCSMYLGDFDNQIATMAWIKNSKYVKNITFNNADRVEKYLKYNLALSGGSYGSSLEDENIDACSPEVVNVLKEMKK